LRNTGAAAWLAQNVVAGIEHVGSDLKFRGSIAAPTILVREMTISGQ
jgi:hypothetical protein